MTKMLKAGFLSHYILLLDIEKMIKGQLTVNIIMESPLYHKILKNLLRTRLLKSRTKIDHIRAFHQIPVAEEDVIKTAVTTPLGWDSHLEMHSKAFKGL